jgi:hypothetical protein
MSNLPVDLRVECRQFLDELETVPARVAPELWREPLARLSDSARAHAKKCASCEGALEDLLATRNVLAPMAAILPEAGPWFAARVMAGIRAKEKEMEAKREGVWISVRRLAPRLVAFCTLLLLLGGTWALQLRRADLAQRQENRPVETVFDSTGQGSPFNDDILAPVKEGRP